MAKRILIVDDNRPLVRMMISALETLPYPVKVSSVPSGEEAMLSVMVERPDLMVVDLHLPGMNGLDLIRILRDRYSELKIVMATGEHDSSVFRRAEELGVEYHFPKPFETVAFLDAVNRILSGQALNVKSLQMPSEPPERMDDAPTEITFADAVVQLQKQLSAKCVAIIGDNGRIIVQAGEEFSKLLSEGWELPLMSSLNAMDVLQRLLPGESQAQFQVFQRNEVNVLVSPLGRHGLIVITPFDKKKPFCQKEIETILDIQRRVSAFVVPFAVSDVPADGVEEPAAETEPVMEEMGVPEIDLSSLLSGAAAATEADSFWEMADEEDDESVPVHGNTGYLDFSQAQRLGLTPQDEG
jgi:CheY-like chemotaxis protein